MAQVKPIANVFIDKSSTIVSTLLRRQHKTYLSQWSRFIGAFTGGGSRTVFQFYSWQYQGSKEEVIELKSLQRYQAHLEWTIIESNSVLNADAVYTITMLTLISQIFHFFWNHCFGSVVDDYDGKDSTLIISMEKIHQRYIKQLKKIQTNDDLEIPLMRFDQGDDGNGSSIHHATRGEMNEMHERIDQVERKIDQVVKQVVDQVDQRMQKTNEQIDQRMQKMEQTLNQILQR